jgi:membrane protein implicated in regulation of membrane protease activity
MSIVGILTLVLIAAVIVSILFVVFKMFIGLLPAAIVIVLVIWLISKFNKSSDKDDQVEYYADDTGVHERKKAQNFKVTFEDDDQKHDKKDDHEHKEDESK